MSNSSKLPELTPNLRLSRSDADQLAVRFSKKDGLRLARQFQEKYSLEPAASPHTTVAAEVKARRILDGQHKPVPIGVYQPRTDAWGRPTFTKDLRSANSERYAETTTLIPKRAKLPLKVVLLGESVATGWAFAPEYSLAKRLQERLGRCCRDSTLFQVDDLSVIDLTSEGLLEHLGACFQLNPDVVVVFAGNNWSQPPPSFPRVDLAQSKDASDAFASNGVRGLSHHLRAKSQYRHEATVDSLMSLLRTYGMPAVIVIPEINSIRSAKHVADVLLASV